ncbi:glycosyltransferase family 2 protein [Tessaracoccus rhinocerotis]|uniref:glycosyltransferase family 2 protein n=1 Tax=Tessaracoccus rhinocerotis TaxID=1689449 RepID=UPI00163D81D3|nr:glycosyltransferase family 2 protein [Tessaracoccus rhinocerotis]
MTSTNEVSPPTTLSVIIVSYLRPDLVLACLESIAAHNDLSTGVEIIVVDNSPQATVAEALRTLDTAFPIPLRVIPNDNRGFGEGNNVGASAATGDILLFLNPDTELTAPTFVPAVTHFARDLSAGTLGVQLVGPDGSKRLSFYWKEWSGFTAAALTKLTNRFGLYWQSRMFTSGAALFVRASSFREVGMFDDRIFLYGEERDLFRRIHQAGYTTHFSRSLRIIHHEGGGQTESLSGLRHRLQSRAHYSDKFARPNLNRFLRNQRRRELVRLALAHLRGVKSAAAEHKARIAVIDEFIHDSRQRLRNVNGSGAA